MDQTSSERGDNAARKDHIDVSAAMSGERRPRGHDRREDGGLFGPYEGPERRSSGERRTPAT
jgi:hypothetical protein